MKIPKVKAKPNTDPEGGRIRNFGPKEAAIVGIATGVTSNAINQKVNFSYGKHEYEKATMYKRRTKNGKKVKVRNPNVKPVPVPSAGSGGDTN